jgi:hypothetical protein
VLVYQWHDLPGRGARKLAGEDGDVPTMQGIPTDSVFHSGLRLWVHPVLPSTFQIFPILSGGLIRSAVVRNQGDVS